MATNIFSLSICDQNLFLTHAAAFFRQHFQPLHPQQNEKKKLSAETNLLTGHYQQVKKLGKNKGQKQTALCDCAKIFSSS